MLTEVYDQSQGDPYFTLTQNKLKFPPIVINYDIFNLLGVADMNTTLTSLIGKTVTVQYMDYGKETSDRDGLPIVITRLISSQ
jgi:hypothetical protein